MRASIGLLMAGCAVSTVAARATVPEPTTPVPLAEPEHDAVEPADDTADAIIEARSPSDAEVALAIGIVQRAIDVGPWTYIEGVDCFQELVVERGLSRIC